MYSNRKKFKIQGYTKSHKKALMKSQVVELIRNGRIKTTPTKAKALKKEFDKVVTAFKKGTPSSNKKVRAFFGENDRAIKRLGDVVEEKLSDRDSGYTRVIKTLPRKGDNADQAYVMLVNTEFEEKKSRLKQALEKKEDSKKKKRGKTKQIEPVKDEKNTGRSVVTKQSDIRRNSK